MQVELKPCVAARDPVTNEITNEHAQWWVHVNGRRFGIVGKQDGSHIAQTSREKFSDSYKAEIQREVEKLIGPRSGVSSPPEPPEEEEQEDDDEA